MAMFSVLITIPVIVEFFGTGLVPRFPTVILSGSLHTSFWVWELRAEGAAPTNNAPILQERFLSNSALMSKNAFTKARAIETPIIKQLSGSDETKKQASDPIDMMQVLIDSKHTYSRSARFLFSRAFSSVLWPSRSLLAFCL